MIVDTNVIIDVIGAPTTYSPASATALSRIGLGQRLVVNLVIFAEASARFSTPEQVEAAFDRLQLNMEPLTNAVAHRAGVAHREYRRAGGARDTILPDFLIGAQADMMGLPILTRDPRRFSTYFRNLVLVDPKGYLDA